EVKPGLNPWMVVPPVFIPGVFNAPDVSEEDQDGEECVSVFIPQEGLPAGDSSAALFMVQASPITGEAMLVETVRENLSEIAADEELFEDEAMLAEAVDKVIEAAINGLKTEGSKTEDDISSALIELYNLEYEKKVEFLEDRSRR
ncbi:MAG: hypothetical protein KAR05_07230, partial [Candidatus Omnitrophica bacterium]|nr:hypothetical protein [Candidatus Omnitrophota bacterium]